MQPYSQRPVDIVVEDEFDFLQAKLELGGETGLFGNVPIRLRRSMHDVEPELPTSFSRPLSRPVGVPLSVGEPLIDETFSDGTRLHVGKARLCSLCSFVVESALTSGKPGQPPNIEIQDLESAEFRSRCENGCPLCNFCMLLAGEPVGPVSVASQPFPTTFWRGGIRYELFEPAKIAEPADYASNSSHDYVAGSAILRRPQRDLPPRTDAPESIELMRAWLDICRTQHPHCERGQSTMLPTRVIDVSSQGNGSDVRLVDGKSHAGGYVALSHCWGGQQHITTTKANYLAHKYSIPLATLPQTFLDAVNVARALGIRYVWIDSLCIIQDDKYDWASEANKMAGVYSNALLTISALKAKSSKDGLFSQAPPAGFVLFNWKPTNCSQNIKVGMRPAIATFDDEMLTSPLVSRGWVYQERLLSSAVLHFGRAQLFWECKSAVYSQTIPKLEKVQPAMSRYFSHFGYISQDLTRQFWTTFAQFEAKQKNWRNGPGGWKDVVRTLTQKQFTNPADRYAASLGIAKLFESVANSRVMAGLWLDDVYLQLAWVYDEKAGLPLAPSQALRVPSWSWVAVDYPVTWMYDVEERYEPNEPVGFEPVAVGDHTLELIEYAQQSTDQFILNLKNGFMVQPTGFEGHSINGRMRVFMENRRDWEVYKMRGTLDPGRELPKKIHLLRLALSQFTTLGEAAIFLILRRVGMPGVKGSRHLGTFKRIGIGSSTYDKMWDFFRVAGKEGPLSLV